MCTRISRLGALNMKGFRNEMLDLKQINESICGLDEKAAAAAVDHWNSVAKPIGSLGTLEKIIVQIAGLQASEQVDISKRCVIAMCADNGVVAQGVSQSGPEVTTLIAGNMHKGISSVCVMAKTAMIDVIPVDVGMLTPAPGVRDCHITRSTADMTQGPAMTREQALAAIEVGINMVAEVRERGFGLVVSGEMGIGNTTTSSAVASVLLGREVEEMTGVGAGLSSAGLARKVDAIKRAIEVNRPDADDALDVLAKLGGYDTAGMAGLFIGGALYGIPVLVDGFISAVAALIAKRLCPKCACAIVATHVSGEPAARSVLDALGVEPVISAGMRLGEGCGAVCLVPMLDMALALYNGTSFDSIGLEAYEVNPH